MRFIDSWGRILAAGAGFGVSLLYCALLLLMRRDRSRLSRDVARLMSRLCCAPVRISVCVHNAERLESVRPCVYIANHQSYLDYPILGRVLPTHTIIVGKSGMARIPVVGTLFRLTGHVLVARGGGGATRDVLDDLRRAMHDDGVSAWMFPEGTRRTTSDVALLPFRSGAFRLAAEANAVIVPIVVDELKPRTDVKRRRFDRRVVNVHVLEPIVVDGAHADSVARAMQDAQAHMRACLAAGSESP